jgi:HNH endonuclease
MTILERFDERWLPCKRTGCWIWTGYLSVGSKGGYGSFVFRPALSRSKKTVSAHRMSWELRCGPIPPGMSVLHRCDVRRCVNPEHLFLGTQSDNMRDMASKGRTHKPQGERNGRSKLLATQVAEIRRLLRAGATQREVARMFAVSASQVSQINTGVRWTESSGE